MGHTQQQQQINQAKKLKKKKVYSADSTTPKNQNKDKTKAEAHDVDGVIDANSAITLNAAWSAASAIRSDDHQHII